MAVKIRLQRHGKRQRPFYRVVAADSRKPLQGHFLEILGTYDPILEAFNVDKEKVSKWLKNGAQMTDTTRTLFKKYELFKK